MISISHLTVSYDKGKPVINDLSVTLTKSKIHGLVGLNGSGKSTLLNAMIGFKNIESGEVMMDGNRLTKRDVAFLSTENFFYSNITGREYLRLFGFSLEEMERWNRLFLLSLDSVIDGYSTGMKKKLAFMAMLKQDKPLYILDEPFNGLDIETCRIIRSILLKMKSQNKTIIITSHIIETLTNLCDEMHYLEAGKITDSCQQQDFKAFETSVFEAIENRNGALIDELMG